jgi:hypothetical protein
LHLLHRKVIMLYLERLLRLDRALAPIDILSVEHSYYDNMTFDVDGKTHSLVIGGYIDRLDQVVRHGRKAIRVIDYKTGTPLTTLPADMSDVFDSQYVDSKHTAYYLQAMLYASIIRNNNKTHKMTACRPARHTGAVVCATGIGHRLRPCPCLWHAQQCSQGRRHRRIAAYVHGRLTGTANRNIHAKHRLFSDIITRALSHLSLS